MSNRRADFLYALQTYMLVERVTAERARQLMQGALKLPESAFPEDVAGAAAGYFAYQRGEGEAPVWLTEYEESAESRRRNVVIVRKNFTRAEWWESAPAAAAESSLPPGARRLFAAESVGAVAMSSEDADALEVWARGLSGYCASDLPFLVCRPREA